MRSTSFETQEENNNSLHDSTLPKKVYSLLPDLITGWKPKNISIPAPILITYECELTEMLMSHYTVSKPDDLIYLGIYIIKDRITISKLILISSTNSP